MAITAAKIKQRYDEKIALIGSTYTKTRRTITLDPLGYETSETTSTSTITGEFQLTQDEGELTDLGNTPNSSARFYGRASDDIQEGDIVSINGSDWSFKRELEDSFYNGTRISSVWLITKIDG